MEIAADGTFSGTTPHSTSGPLGSEGGTLSFTGRVASDTRIDGTVTADATVRLKDKAPYDCSAGPVAYTMFDNAPDPNAAPPTPGGIYAARSPTAG